MKTALCSIMGVAVLIIVVVLVRPIPEIEIPDNVLAQIPDPAPVPEVVANSEPVVPPVDTATDELDTEGLEEDFESGDSDPSFVEIPEVDGVKAITFRYADDGFDFENHTIVLGGSVFFNNISDEALQLHSDPHPVHSGYDGLNVGALGKGEILEVVFTELGEIGFHNHLNSIHSATVIVVESL
jgi:hypothetical protein